MANPNQIQQGDVIFRRVSEPVSGKRVARDARGIVLAEGEATGHAHVIEETDDAELYREGERMLLSITKEKTVRHQEHGPVNLPPGVWEVGRVREFDYMSQMARRVQD